MARTSTYLNFMGTTEQAFEFYKTVFQTEFNGPIHRMGDVPPAPGMPTLSDQEKKMVMHVEMPIIGGHVLSPEFGSVEPNSASVTVPPADSLPYK